MKTVGYIRRTFRNGNREYICTVMHGYKNRHLKRAFKRARDAMAYGEKVVARWNRMEDNKDGH